MTATLHGSVASPHLTDAAAAAIEARVKTLEARTGTQVVAAVVERSDVYHGLRWRAFAVAVSLTGFAVALLDEFRPAWPAEQRIGREENGSVFAAVGDVEGHSCERGSPSGR